MTSRVFVVGLLCGALAISAPATRVYAVESPVALFQKAQKAFYKGKLKIASKLVATILKRYPDNQPAHLLLGRILFRAGKVGSAAKQFAHVGADLIGPEVAYEYGITMFQAKDCKRANFGLSRVSERSRLIDLAYFYRGVCAFRMRDYIHAQAYLGRANDLPANLEGTRRQALDQVRQLTRAERGGAVGSPQTIIIVPQPPPPVYADNFGSGGDAAQGNAAGGDDKGDDKPKKPAPPPPPPPPGWQSVTTPSVTYTQTNDSNDYWGYKSDDSQTSIVDIAADFKTKYTGAPRAGGGQPYFSLDLNLDDKQTTTNGNNVTYVAYSTDPTSVVQQVSPDPNTSTTVGTVLLNPEGDIPIGASADAAAGYKYSNSFVDLKSTTTNGTQGPYAWIEYGKTLVLKVQGTMNSLFDQTGKTSETDIIILGDLTKNFDSGSAELSYTMTQASLTTKPATAFMPPGTFDGTTGVAKGILTKTWDTFTLTAEVDDTQYTPSSTKLIKAAEDSNLKASISGTKTIEIGGNFTLTVSMTQLGAYKAQIDDPSAPAPDPASAGAVTPKLTVKADGQQEQALASFKLAPVDWVYGQVQFKYTNTEFTGVDPKVVKAFDLANGLQENQSEFQVTIGLTKSF